MTGSLVLPVLIGLLPVLAFLGALRSLDSYRLVRLRDVLGAVVSGALVAGLGWLLNGWLLGVTGLELREFSRWVAPFSEELLKCLFIVALILAHRIGFLVDAAIFGFAVGTGFALVENLYFLHLVPHANMSTWTVRGLGTAVMHGGSTAIFAVMSLALLERNGGRVLRACLPGLLLAVVVHSVYNHLGGAPLFATLAVIISLPLLFYWVFQRSEAATRDWLGHGFDTDLQMLEMVGSGQVADTPVGHYLETLRGRFAGPVLADVLCYLRLYTELALRAKGLLMMRENSFAAELDDATRANLAELRYLEGSIGRAGLLAARPLLRMSPKELRQLSLLEGA